MRARLLCLLLAIGCAPTQAELQRPVDRDLDRRLGEPVHVFETKLTKALLSRPLDRAAAVKVALARSPRLHAALAELGISGGDFASALGLGPLHIEANVKFGSFGAEYEVHAIQNLLGLITAPRRRAAARANLVAAQALATGTALRLVARVEIAFADLLAAQQSLELRRTAFDAADAAAQIRERMHAAGNTTDLAQARDRDAREQARLDVARAEATVEIKREELNALLGLSGDDTKWTATGMLADIPADAPKLDDLEQAAVAASLDLEASRARVTGATNATGAEGVRAWLPDFGIGVAAETHDGEIIAGPAVRLGIPLFDNRSGERARARAELSRAEHELAAVAVELRAGARAARIAALAAYQEAKHIREVVLPLRQQIVDQTLLHYNAMDADPFALIIARRQLADGGQQYLDALRRYANAMSQVTALRRGVHLGMTEMPDSSTRSAAPAADSH